MNEMNYHAARSRLDHLENLAAAACCEPMPCTAPEDRVSAARRRHDAARNRHASSAAVVRKAREVLTHLEHDAYIAEHELREANEELVRALRVGA